MLHKELSISGILNTIGVTVDKEKFWTATQPFASVTETEYEPAQRPLIEVAFTPFDHEVVYAGVPPDIKIEIFPSHMPLQVISFFVEVIIGPLIELIEYTCV